MTIEGTLVSQVDLEAILCGKTIERIMPDGPPCPAQGNLRALSTNGTT